MSQNIQNVVLVVIDALRYDRVGLYTDERQLTPHIDELGKRGTVFENAFACTNATDPSVTSIQSGRDPETVVKHHGPFVSDREKNRAESIRTVPEILQASGFDTVATGRTLGRWHANGFDHYPEARVGRYERRAVGEALEKIHPKLRTIAGRAYEVISFLYDSGDTNEIDEFLGEIGEDPFYGMIHMMDTHVPYTHTEDCVREMLNRFDYPNRDFETFLEEHGDGKYVGDFLLEHSDGMDFRDGLARWYAKYDAAVVNADRKVGALLDGLKDRGLLEETLVIVTSDHGESLDEHGIYFDHHGLYDPQIHVPLIVAGPSIQSRRRDEFVQLYDLAPTILDLLNQGKVLKGEGRTLTPLLKGSGPWQNREFIVAQEAHAQRRISIRTQSEKYIKHVPDEVLERERGSSLRCGYCNRIHEGERELYRLTDDPAEETNIVDQFSDRATSLDEKLSEYFDGLRPPEQDAEHVTYDDEKEVLERLEELGYR